MDGRLAYALTHPLTDPATDAIEPYRTVEVQPDGNLLMTVLAVDR
jgi:hypothetical protein